MHVRKVWVLIITDCVISLFICLLNFYIIALEDDPAYTKVLFRRAQANEKVNTLFSTNSALEGIIFILILIISHFQMN